MHAVLQQSGSGEEEWVLTRAADLSNYKILKTNDEQLNVATCKAPPLKMKGMSLACRNIEFVIVIIRSTDRSMHNLAPPPIHKEDQIPLWYHVFFSTCRMITIIVVYQ